MVHAASLSKSNSTKLVLLANGILASGSREKHFPIMWARTVVKSQTVVVGGHQMAFESHAKRFFCSMVIEFHFVIFIWIPPTQADEIDRIIFIIQRWKRACSNPEQQLTDDRRPGRFRAWPGNLSFHLWWVLDGYTLSYHVYRCTPARTTRTWSWNIAWMGSVIWIAQFGGLFEGCPRQWMQHVYGRWLRRWW